MQELMKEIQNKIDSDTRNPQEIYSFIKQLGTYMIMTNTLGKENVVSFCSSLLKLYDILRQKE